jgi:PAS domain S-box-containing protein
MTDNASSKDSFAKLRRQAEALLKEGKNREFEAAEKDLSDVVNELEVHQIELDLQNKELLRAAGDPESAREDYFKLWDSAPVGFLTVDRDGTIERINATAAGMFQRPVNLLVGQKFSNLVHTEDLPAYFAGVRNIARSGVRGAKDSLELRLCGKDDSGMYVRLDLGAQFDEQGHFSRWQFAITDVTRSKKAEAALRETEDRYFVIFDTSPFAIALTKMPEGATVEVNDAFLKLLEYTREEVVGKPGVDLGISDADSQARMREELQRRGSVREFEVTRKTKSGAQRNLSISLDWVSIGGEKHVLTTIQDITERKRAERELFESKQRLATLMHSLPVGVSFSDDPTCRRITGNQALLAQFEITSEDNISASALDATTAGRRVRYFHDGRELTDADLPLQRAVAGNREIPPTELEILLPSGRRWIAAASGAPLRDPSGQVTGGVAVTIDTTGRKQAEEALRQAHAQLEQRVLERTAELQASQLSLALSEERFRQMAENVEDAFWLADADLSRILYISPSFEKVWGRTCAELYQNPRAWLDAVHPEDRERVQAAFFHKSPGEAPLRAEYRIVRPDGTVRWIADRASWVRDAAGRVYRMAGVARDTTKRKEAEQSLARVNRALRAITACNNALLRATSETELFGEICRIIVKVGGYGLVWVGLAEHDSKKTVRPVAYEGDGKDYLDKRRITWSDSPRGRGPAATAIRTQKPVLLHDLPNHPGFAPWRRFAEKLGFHSAIGLPLLGEGQCYGALTILASEPEAFDPAEVNLLTQLAHDLAFGITALRTRVERQRLEKQVLEISEREQRRIGQDLHDGLGQRIVAARFMCSALAQKLAKDKQPAAEHMAQLESELIQAIEETRQIARGLQPVRLDAESLMHALHELADSVTKMFGIPCQFICRRAVLVPDHAAAIHLYRIAQEATNNAARHGGPKQIRISLSPVNGGIRLRVEDDGCGLPAAGKPGSGLGLGIMRHRASVIGATFAVGPGRSGGTTVTCHWKPSPEEPHTREDRQSRRNPSGSLSM